MSKYKKIGGPSMIYLTSNNQQPYAFKRHYLHFINRVVTPVAPRRDTRHLYFRRART